MDRARYQLGEARASAMLALLDASAELLSAEGQTELAFELDHASAGQLPPRVTLRFSVGQEFGELRVADSDGGTSVAHVYAAGPIERILHAIGFRELSRAVVIARRYRFEGAEVRVAHSKPVGWYCEIRPDLVEDLPRVASALGAANLPTERRLSDRRDGERRLRLFQFMESDRRTSPDRRGGDRRLAALT